ncbi:MAG: indolepyruvate oxidoreductase subunit beta [Eubacteriales bacterium]
MLNNKSEDSNEVKNILLVGVGGQGTILASKILSKGLVEAGYDVKMSEVHGMSQRGGNVSTQIRYGKKVYSPIIGKGQADLIVAFEKMEALRWIDYLKTNGKMVINDYEIPSVPILMGKEKYPEEIVENIGKLAKITVVKAADIAKELGNSKMMNVVLLGALIKALEINDVDWEQTIRDSVKESFREINIKAFQKGYSQL